MTFLKRALGVLALLAAALWLNNTSHFVSPPDTQQPELLSHRGVHQIYAGTDRTNDTCSANPVHPFQHDYIANTLRSMTAAFDHGAAVVELDIHLTPDNVFAVFHDWTLDCQTDGTGVTHKQTFDTLRALDLGYGYTSDGTTYPLRGTGVGAMPSLTEVLNANLDGQILINFKSNRASEGKHLATLLQNPDHMSQVFGVYGGAPPTQAVIENTPQLRGFDKPALKSCLISYALIGWAGIVPEQCANRIIAVPMDYGPFLWGWPHKFTNRMKSAGTRVILWGPYDGSGFSSGVDDIATLARTPAQFDGLIWTNRIEIIGPALAQQISR